MLLTLPLCQMMFLRCQVFLRCVVLHGDAGAFEDILFLLGSSRRRGLTTFSPGMGYSSTQVRSCECKMGSLWKPTESEKASWTGPETQVNSVDSDAFAMKEVGTALQD